jgi:hypothetical protein
MTMCNMCYVTYRMINDTNLCELSSLF